jgi:predicted O-methyltransferase YrrM
MGIYEQLEIPEKDRLTSVQKAEAEFMHEFIKEHGLSKTLETGFAYGCSAAHILSATKTSHITIDPYQDTYNNLGLANMEKLGFNKRLRFMGEFSHSALPKLLSEGVTLDFMFVDGGHNYDKIFIDFYYGDLLLQQNGYIFFDDAWLRATQVAAAFISTNRKDYALVSTPIPNLIAFKKIGQDDRTWEHFVEFAQA